ncbi:MAG: glutamyl-tRNA reductase [Chlamydiota bacterium]|jgi:glutamyl-tRNA reductase
MHPLLRFANQRLFIDGTAVLGISYKTAQLPFLEMMARAAEGFVGEKRLFFPYPTVLLRTCNRIEIYFSAPDLGSAHSAILALLRRSMEEPFEHRLYSYFGVDCLTHLCRVAAGLDSASLGESDIQRQVKLAYLAQDKGLPSAMHRVFQKALHIAKKVRQEGLLGPAPSLNKAIWEAASETLGSLVHQNILLVGFSDIHRSLAAYLTQRGASNIVFCTKDPSLLPEVRAVDRSALHRWSDYGVVSAATAADTYLITGTTQKAVAVFDLSLPRVVDPAIASNKNVTLWNIEEINRLVREQQGIQTDRLLLCEAIIRERIIRMQRDLGSGGTESHRGCFPCHLQTE